MSNSALSVVHLDIVVNNYDMEKSILINDYIYLINILFIPTKWC